MTAVFVRLPGSGIALGRRLLPALHQTKPADVQPSRSRSDVRSQRERRHRTCTGHAPRPTNRLPSTQSIVVPLWSSRSFACPSSGPFSPLSIASGTPTPPLLLGPACDCDCCPYHVSGRCDQHPNTSASSEHSPLSSTLRLLPSHSLFSVHRCESACTALPSRVQRRTRGLTN